MIRKLRAKWGGYSVSHVKQAPSGGRLSLSASLAFAAISLPLAALGLSVGVQLPPTSPASSA